MDWNDESQKSREGLDLGGADLRNVNLSGLPLSRMNGFGWAKSTDINDKKFDILTIHLEGANLSFIHLEGANLYRASLDEYEKISGKQVNSTEEFFQYVGSTYPKLCDDLRSALSKLAQKN